MTKKMAIVLLEPKPFDIVGLKFVISGLVPECWLKTDSYTDDRILLDFLDINGKTFRGESIYVQKKLSWLCRLLKRVPFYAVVGFHEFNTGFLVQSQGRVVIKLSGHQKKQVVFIPVIVKEFEPLRGVDSEIVRLHKNIEKMVLQYDDDIKNYDSELEALENKRLNAIGQSNELQDELGIEEGDFLYGIFGALESLEDEERFRLETRYKDALEWAGPRFGGGVGRLNGFVFMVYSDDHGEHFHVLHRGRGVNARFSFPDIDLINYKNSRNVINSREVEVIRKYFQDPLNFEKLKSEFKKRNTIDTSASSSG